MAYPRQAFCLTLLLMLPMLHYFAVPDDEDTTGPSGHAPAPPVKTVSECYLAGMAQDLYRRQDLAESLEAIQQRKGRPCGRCGGEAGP
jgi:hypothetical protein